MLIITPNNPLQLLGIVQESWIGQMSKFIDGNNHSTCVFPLNLLKRIVDVNSTVHVVCAFQIEHIHVVGNNFNVKTPRSSNFPS
jgi:hypothetical protein